MIFVVLGTHELPFTRLVKEIDELIQRGIIQEEVMVQSGHTSYESERMTLIPFLSFEEMDQTFADARIVIAHGGTGSIITGVKKEKPVIAVPRLAKHGEHNDDHQLEIVDQFHAAGHIIGVEGPEQLEDALKQAETFQPVPFKSGKEQILRLLEDFIDNV
ncbi:UDP-N-acetylglucosamine transferase subunit ALG13 [Alteribacillus persepolensis]|uniref:UDP-N-acetylglucosamine transferase subunit ALG13 n=1 Tax=Alteribacillus persepolensis TaxID=568899 RepID=A0A1G8ADD8_9BACI|nr:PssE/Cps14G family polysaccharide biosynthesis glycosyltransferase [Alteribacillus persepolensis]SDH18901.1 UDP-N-acetylglucosamine transferase subunit ALG13 [Alteribacillus persepolensis]